MKLYTEEQVLRMLTVCRDSDLYEHILTFEDVLKTQAPIELPSDDELGKEGLKQWGNVHSVGVVGWIDGARWMRNKIQGGNK